MTPDGAPHGYRFDRFVLDPQDRRLTRDGQTVELNSRYLDALALMLSEPGRLVSKDRFMAEVWKGIPVTDEALTQCIRSLRKALGDDAARPRFIETAPKHGYRFIATVETGLAAPAAPEPPAAIAPPTDDARPANWRKARVIAAAGMLGGGAAGLVGGLIYGLICASDQSGEGASAVVVLTGLTLWVGLIGGAGVGAGMGLANLRSARLSAWTIFGGAVGGLIIGALVKLVGSDAFALLFGQTPGRITGAVEGLFLGAAVGLGAWVAQWGDERLRARRGAAVAGIVGAVTAVLISLSGGRLMGGSLEEISARFPASRLSLDAFGPLVGEPTYGPLSHAVSAGLEGFLFASTVVGVMVLALRSLDRSRASATRPRG